ncbi:hypothetical protein Bca4012_102292 [Brassica carinata]|nr:unnamed protein product [Brassica napus]VDD64872.1 unnamed protein product [Brassica oleracea]
MMTGGRNDRRLSIDSQKVSGSVCTPRRFFSRERGVKISPSHHLLICFPKTVTLLKSQSDFLFFLTFQALKSRFYISLVDLKNIM